MEKNYLVFPKGTFPEKTGFLVEMKHALRMEISIHGFCMSHLLQLSTNRFFRLNAKPTILNSIGLN